MKANMKKFEDFIKKIRDAKIVSILPGYPGKKPYFWGKDSEKEENRWEKTHSKGYWISCEWTSGGVSGGSCWDTGDDDPHHPDPGEPEPEFEDLDNILTLVVPQITLMQYKQVIKVVERSERRSDDYYGNYTDYGIKFVNLKTLFDKLQEMGLV